MKLAFDTETGGLNWWDPREQAFLGSWADGRSSSHVAVDRPGNGDYSRWRRFIEALDKADTLVAHNLNFDVHQVRATTSGDLLEAGKKLIDTATLARVAVPERRQGVEAEDGEDPRAGFDLESLSRTYLPEHEQKIDLEDLAKSHGIKLKGDNATPQGYYKLWLLEPAAVEEYARRDTEATLALEPKLMSLLTARNRPIWELERDVQPHIIRAEQVGVAVDQEKVGPLKAEYERRRAEAHDRTVAALGSAELKGDALIEALLSHGVPLHRRSDKTGKLLTNKFALDEFAEAYPVLADLQEWRTADKFLSTYIDPMVGRDTIHTSFWQIGAWTGRMSCSRPNMQNIPIRAGSEVREVFVPRPGHSFVVCDFDSIELRLLAYYLNDPDLRAKVAGGHDTFADLAAHLAATVRPEWAEEYGTDMANYQKGAPGEKRRGDCKNVTYAITYGAGKKRITDMLGLDPGPVYKGKPTKYYQPGDYMHAEAKEIIDTVKSWLPNYMDFAGRYDSRVREKVKKSGFVTTIMGRKQPVNKDKGYVGLNALIQGSAADIMKRAIILTAERVAPLEATPVLFVHDEIVVETPTEHAPLVLGLTKLAMEESYDLNPRLAVSGTIAHNNYAEGK